MCFLPWNKLINNVFFISTIDQGFKTLAPGGIHLVGRIHDTTNRIWGLANRSHL